MKDLNPETTVLGALLLEKNAWDEVCTMLAPESFEDPTHALVFAIIADLHRQQKAVDLLTVATTAMKLHPGKVDFYTLSTFTANVATATNIKAHAAIVAENAAKRKIVAAAMQVQAKADELSADELAALLRTEIEKTEEVTSDGATNLKDYLPTLAAALQEKDTASGLTTGFPTLDRHLSGLKPGRLYIVGGRPGQGKTSVALFSAIENAKAGKNTLFISAEQDVADLAAKIVGNTSGLGHQQMDRRDLSAHDWMKLDAAFAQIMNFPGTVFLKDNPGNINHLSALIRTLNRRAGLDLVVVDYLQLIHGATKNNARMREQEVAEISRTLKKLTISEKLPIIALSQLNREATGVPKLSNLRESGAIEQDADAVLLIYRPALDGSMEHGPDYGEIHIAKNRRGAAGLAIKFYNKDMAVFSEQPLDRPF